MKANMVNPTNPTDPIDSITEQPMPGTNFHNEMEIATLQAPEPLSEIGYLLNRMMKGVRTARDCPALQGGANFHPALRDQFHPKDNLFQAKPSFHPDTPYGGTTPWGGINSSVNRSLPVADSINNVSRNI